MIQALPGNGGTSKVLVSGCRGPLLIGFSTGLLGSHPLMILHSHRVVQGLAGLEGAVIWATAAPAILRGRRGGAGVDGTWVNSG